MIPSPSLLHCSLWFGDLLAILQEIGLPSPLTPPPPLPNGCLAASFNTPDNLHGPIPGPRHHSSDSSYDGGHDDDDNFLPTDNAVNESFTMLDESLVERDFPLTLDELYDKAREVVWPLGFGPVSNTTLHVLLYQIQLLGQHQAHGIRPDQVNRGGGVDPKPIQDKLDLEEVEIDEWDKLMLELVVFVDDHRLSRSATSDLLHYIRKLNVAQGVPLDRQLPKDPRTLRKRVEEIRKAALDFTTNFLQEEGDGRGPEGVPDGRVVELTFHVRDFLDPSGPGGGNVRFAIQEGENDVVKGW